MEKTTTIYLVIALHNQWKCFVFVKFVFLRFASSISIYIKLILLHILCTFKCVLSGYRLRNANIHNAIRVKIINFITFHFTFFVVDVIRHDNIGAVCLFVFIVVGETTQKWKKNTPKNEEKYQQTLQSMFSVFVIQIKIEVERKSIDIEIVKILR